MKQLNQINALKKFIVGRDDFKIRNNELICLFCSKELSYSVKEGTKTLKQHLETKVHKENKNRLVETKSFEAFTSLKIINQTFDEKIVEAFAAANIPLYKLQNPVLKGFLEKYTNMSILDESHYRKLILQVYDRKREKIFDLSKE
ncbi:hypothetical protein DMUE_1712 [Dictyocoela muelleri]|nr:hypothetical protein DMUE_1712 [Dictyocoela muelleri]